MKKIINLEIDDDTAEGLVRAMLKESIDVTKWHIKDLKKIKKPESFQKEDLADSILHLDHLQKTYEYYGGK